MPSGHLYQFLEILVPHGLCRSYRSPLKQRIPFYRSLMEV
ncbi:hypothetical protein L21SP2_3170 [Salinispira pacifica]|uniref:Uncharacterized protein n=1 Tax=Salinispira pacifica TaxID=1307761 RepID=V5WLN6_9SPIO|nr:hypothetical protein L21SP2_3170 [Salinispira pacifica]